MDSQLSSRIMRRIMAWLPKTLLSNKNSWRWLAFYPRVTITEQLLQEWNSSHWEEYQWWLEKHSLQSLEVLTSLSDQARQSHNPPRFSLVTPVFNTDPDVLIETILSVRAQAYPYWQLLLVDDGSTLSETHQVLTSKICADPRIQIISNSQSQGISRATNRGIDKAQGDYVIFLDHDDRLALEALYVIATEIVKNPDLDIIYSDRDMISEEGKRYLHVFKPDWSPEALLSGNYLFHLMCYRRELLEQLGGLRSDYDGSQDYDLILRAAECEPKVCHIAQILYHWRQHAASVALNVHAKDYAFKAGIKALNDALVRRGMNAHTIEIPDFWRGTYQVEGLQIDRHALQVIRIDRHETAYADIISRAIADSDHPYIAILGAEINPADSATLTKLAAWLTFEQVGLVTGKILNAPGDLDYVGMAYKRDASLIYPYQGFSRQEPGYLGVTQLVRNISAPHPFCVVIRRSLWDTLQGFDAQFSSPYALLDFALRALQLNWRSVIVPQCCFDNRGETFAAEMFSKDRPQFEARWQAHLEHGDPYYNRNLAENSRDMGLDI